MAKHFLFYRIVRYYKANGLTKTLRRSFEMLWQKTFRKRFVIFFVELTKLNGVEIRMPQNFAVECRKNAGEITKDEFESLTHYGGERIIRYELKNRFGKGAYLWLMKVDGKDVGMVWTIRQKTLKPYYWPMTPNDVHLFDNEVFRDYRGQGINPFLINYVVFELKKKGVIRAFIETSEINKPEIRSLSKTSFTELGRAGRLHLPGWNITIWSKIGCLKSTD